MLKQETAEVKRLRDLIWQLAKVHPRYVNEARSIDRYCDPEVETADRELRMALYAEEAKC